ncbi:Morn repeat incomplete domain containing protein [Pandoravirus salinus]|uniref:Morn repeat incomplete domain containing protein n=1 Tax=Pandoravirus salinus TaxID=1349410 RepID=S4VVY9_9VIRU|nr:morn repeat incomplete domain [Pandoravirus salinus]AGO84819.1 Morn repeat incomplete domain containing protein [Pandoravirus salinus]
MHEQPAATVRRARPRAAVPPQCGPCDSLSVIGRSTNDDTGENAPLPLPTIDDLPAEIQVMIVNRLADARDLLALRATSRVWRLLMAGERGPVYALCRPLLPDEALERLASHPEGDLLMCVLYGMLGPTHTSLRSIEPTQRRGTTYWVPRPKGVFCGWGLALGDVHMSGGPPLHVWAVGLWSNDRLFDGVTRAVDLVGAVQGDTWHWRSPHITPACRRAMRRAHWVGRVADGAAHGRGVWQVSGRHRCERRDAQCGVTCVGQWSKGALVSGTMMWCDGHVYRGEFLNNLFHGFGTLDMGHHARYVGGWSAGKPDGHGTLYDGESHWNDSDPVPSFYCGGWCRGKQDGVGAKEWQDGRQYVGVWANGRFEGRGSFKHADGSRHDGKWHWGERHGQGECFGPDGRRRRRGYWVRDLPCSRLTYRHYKETGYQKSTTRCALSMAGRPLHGLARWVDKPLINS